MYTDRELLVFGFASADPEDHTWAEPKAYDPVADRWRPMSLRGAPKDRLFTFLTWLPSVRNVLMCDQLGTWCARYDPAANAWRMSATPPAPPDARDWRSGYALDAQGFRAFPGGAVAFTRAADTDTRATLDVRTHLYDAARDVWIPAVSPPSADAASTTSWASLHADAARVFVWERPFVLDVDQRAWLRSPPFGERWSVSNESARVHASSIVRERPRRPGEPGGARALELLLRAHHQDRDSSEWCLTLPGDAPRERLDTGRVAEAAYGECLLLYASTASLGAGHICCPAQDGFTCERMSTEGEPTFRRGFASAFTGTDLIVWGGFEPDGGRVRALECAGADCAHTFRPVLNGARYRPPATHQGVRVPRCAAP